MKDLTYFSKESDLHLVVGINRYKNAALNLTYAETDAKGVQGFFQSADAKKLFKNVHVYSLISEQATGQNIKNLFTEVGKKAQPQDTLLIYLAGHGDTVGEEWYFIPHDVVSPEIEQDLKKGGISNGAISEAIKQCRAQKVFVMIDACKRASSSSPCAAPRRARPSCSLPGPRAPTSSRPRRTSSTPPRSRRWATGGEKKVTVEGLIHYVKEKLPELTEKHRGAAQYPVSWGSGMDFPLALH